MSSFKYQCVDLTGKETSGTLTASTISEARTVLKDKGLKVVSIAESVSIKSPFSSFSVKKTTVGEADLYNMAKELSVLLRAGLRIDNSLEIVTQTASNQALKACLRSAVKEIRAGKSVADAFEKTGTFNNLMLSVIRVGESVGDLKMSFEQIAGNLQFQIQFKAEIKNNLTYPVFLILASMVTLFIIFKFIIPRFFSVFGADQIKNLPAVSKMLFAMSEYLNLYVIFGVIIAIVLFFKYVGVKKLFHSAYARALSLPVFRTLILNLELSRFSYSMHTMLSSGIEFIKALKYSIDLIQNERIRNVFQPALKLIKEGRSIGEVFSGIEMLPDIVPSMVTVGEKSGNMKEIFLELFNVFDDRFKRAVKRIVILIEPAIIILMGIIVGFIVISLILTVMNVGNIKL
ncbi:type II secretion system F family protein [Candidatus Magnetomonas plexicatena]|uniref:type II secretion system F family protein n=1 Tax=Candidatus Magnetomonas plexicatena TaxID=2552947 RepID=UPI001C747C6A|nr:type II secretion system F family protein [Nitrospirales bacterium LBB_01]